MLKPIALVLFFDFWEYRRKLVRGELLMPHSMLIWQSVELVSCDTIILPSDFAEAILKAHFCSLCMRRKGSSKRKRSCRVSRYVDALAVMSTIMVVLHQLAPTTCCQP
jgi:hypothetical protein